MNTLDGLSSSLDKGVQHYEFAPQEGIEYAAPEGEICVDALFTIILHKAAIFNQPEPEPEPELDAEGDDKARKASIAFEDWVLPFDGQAAAREPLLALKLIEQVEAVRRHPPPVRPA